MVPGLWHAHVGWLILGMAKVGLAWDVVTVTPEHARARLDVVRVLHDRGSLVTFRFSDRLLQRVRQRLIHRPVFVIPGATHANSAEASGGI